MDDVSGKSPDWSFSLDDRAPALGEVERAKVEAVSAVAQAIATQSKSLRLLSRQLERMVTDASAHGLTAEQIADFGQLRLSTLRAFLEGDQPLFPGQN